MALWLDSGSEPQTENEKADLDAIAAIKESTALELKVFSYQSSIASFFFQYFLYIQAFCLRFCVVELNDANSFHVYVLKVLKTLCSKVVNL